MYVYIRMYWEAMVMTLLEVKVEQKISPLDLFIQQILVK